MARHTPEDYPWSSYRYHVWGEENNLIEDHPLYFEQGRTEEERRYSYRELFRVELSERDSHQISHSVHYNYPLGNDRFKEKIEETIKRHVGYAKRGRPMQETIGQTQSLRPLFLLC